MKSPWEIATRCIFLAMVLLLVVVSSSIAPTARLNDVLGYARLREPMAASIVPYEFWIGALTLAILAHFGLVYYASDKTMRGYIVLGFIAGALLGAVLWLVWMPLTGVSGGSVGGMHFAAALHTRCSHQAIPLGVVADVAKQSRLAEATHGFAHTISERRDPAEMITTQSEV